MRHPNLPANVLFDIIRVQTEIAKAGLDFGTVMSLASQHSMALTHACGAAIELVEGEEMVYRAANGTAKPHLGLRLNKEGSLSGMCVETGALMRCDDVENDPRVNLEACRKIGVRSMLVVPLRHQASTVGVLKVSSSKPGFFDETAVGVLTLMSDLIAASMFNAANTVSHELYQRATHDALTGLANRALFFDRLRQQIDHAQRYNEMVGILTIDLKGLRQLNETLGHRAGDEALKTLAQRLAAASRKTDTVARIGSDKFAILLTKVVGKYAAHELIAKLGSQVEGSFTYHDHAVPVETRMGVAVYPDDGLNIEELLDKADL